MSSSEIFITKRDGKRERFSIDKIRAAIAKAFLSVGSFATDEMLTQILGRIRVADGTTVEQIQNQVETALMAERYYKVAKAYIIYRQEHTEDREVRDKLQFLMNYCEAKNPATGSKYDANANVENKNIALSRDKLLSDIWGYDFFGDDRTIDTHIKNLRNNLGPYRDFIVTLRGVGYKFEYEN